MIRTVFNAQLGRFFVRCDAGWGRRKAAPKTKSTTETYPVEYAIKPM